MKIQNLSPVATTGSPACQTRGEALVRLDMLVMRAEVVGRVPRLDDRIEVERGERLRRPAGAAEGHVGVECRDLLGRLGGRR